VWRDFINFNVSARYIFRPSGNSWNLPLVRRPCLNQFGRSVVGHCSAWSLNGQVCPGRQVDRRLCSLQVDGTNGRSVMYAWSGKRKAYRECESVPTGHWMDQRVSDTLRRSPRVNSARRHLLDICRCPVSQSTLSPSTACWDVGNLPSPHVLLPSDLTAPLPQSINQSISRFLQWPKWYEGGSVAEWLACWTQAQKGPGSNRSRDAVG